MDVRSRPVLVYRWLVFLLAVWFAAYHIWTGDFSNFGGPFRKLTHWGLFISLFAAIRMLALSAGLGDRRHEVQGHLLDAVLRLGVAVRRVAGIGHRPSLTLVRIAYVVSAFSTAPSIRSRSRSSTRLRLLRMVA